jgi:hypothetical protein
MFPLVQGRIAREVLGCRFVLGSKRGEEPGQSEPPVPSGLDLLSSVCLARLLGMRSIQRLSRRKGWVMADVHKFSERVIDLAERTSAVADAAQGKRRGGRGIRARWLFLPAAGAGLYALITNGSFARQAKSVASQAKERASDLPEELADRVQQATGQKRSSSSSGSQTKSTSRTSRQRRKTSSAR